MISISNNELKHFNELNHKVGILTGFMKESKEKVSELEYVLDKRGK